MKLLLDENLSRRIVPALQPLYPASSQVALLGLERKTDPQIWQFAKDHGYVLVSKDQDFSNLQAARGFPPKLIRLALGNCTNDGALQALLGAAQEIQRALADETIGSIELY